MSFCGSLAFCDSCLAPPLPAISHSYVDQKDGNHKCDICNDTAAHNMDYTDNKDGKTHNGACSDCDYTVTNEDHKFSGGSCTNCGAKESVKKFVKIKSGSELSAEDTIIFVVPSKKNAAGAYQTTKDFTTVTVTIKTDGTIDADTLPSSVWKFTVGKSGNYFTFTYDGKKMGLNGTSSNRNIAYAASPSNSTWRIEQNGEDIQVINVAATATSMSGYFKCNTVSGKTFFTNYKGSSTGQPDVQIYKLG